MSKFIGWVIFITGIILLVLYLWLMQFKSWGAINSVKSTMPHDEVGARVQTLNHCRVTLKSESCSETASERVSVINKIGVMSGVCLLSEGNNQFRFVKYSCTYDLIVGKVKEYSIIKN